MMRRNKKGNGAVNRANPDFDRAGIKVQGALFVDFGKRIGRRKNLHTDFRSAGEDLRIFGDLWAIGSEPSHVDSLDAISGRHRALPTLEVELGLRNALRHLKGDRHGRRYARKRKNEGLFQLMSQGRIAVMCAESVPWRCHRSLIADALLVRGIRSEEIVSPTRTRVQS
jgi:hypothetical protein